MLPSPTTIQSIKAERFAVPLRVACAIEIPGARQPLTFGVPFAKGQATTTDHFALRDPQHRLWPVQTRITAHWPDGSIKWLLVETSLVEMAPGASNWELLVGDGELAPIHQALVASMVDERASVSTGAYRFRLDICRPDEPTLLCETQSGRLLGHLSLKVQGLRPRVSRIKWQRVILEHAGTLRTIVAIEGEVAKHPQLRLRLRCTFHAGTGLFSCETMLHNAEAARHAGGLWDLGDSRSWLFRDVSLVWNTTQSQRQAQLWVDPHHPTCMPASGGALVQHSSGGRNWRSHNHVDRRGHVPLSRWGYDWQSQEHLPVTGNRATPTFVREDSEGALAVAVPEFWQQFPKALSLSPQEVRIGLFPREVEQDFELQPGERKRHTVWFHLDQHADVAVSSVAWVHAPANIAATAAWHADSGVWSCMLPAQRDPDERLASVMSKAVAGQNNFFAKREAIDEFGWRHFGEVWGDHEGAFFSGQGPVISHYNNQFDLLLGTLVQWLRTSDDAWWQIADPLARHVIDIDIYHTDRDKPAYCGGMFWHTDHYLTAATATHRTYSRYNASRESNVYGGGPGNEHNYATGLLYYYYLTGDADARAAVVGLADWVLRMDDGHLAPWAWLDDGPTGLASRTRDEDFHGPGRGAGNSLNVMLDAWELTGEAKYLEFGETLLKRCIHPRDDVAAHDLLDVERRWSYPVFLLAVARYLRVKAEYKQIDTTYHYAQQSLLHYARWMLAHERLYLDRPEQLQYVTETWAAQDLRKANALRLAAQHADAALAADLVAKGDELADAAWSALLSFPSTHFTRAIAITSVEGTRDYFLRTNNSGALPQAEMPSDFDPPATFIGARQRIRTQLKSWAGCKTLARRVCQRLFARRQLTPDTTTTD